MADIELTGWDEFINKAGGMPERLKEEFAGEVEAQANHWALLASKAAPKDQGNLSQKIIPTKENDLEWNIVALPEYSAFVEFGTKKKVNIPPGLEAYAAEFKGQGQGGNAKVMIYAWMDRVGIPKDKQWFVFISIIVNGIKAQPYLFPQLPIVEPEFIKNVQNIVNTEH